VKWEYSGDAPGGQAKGGRDDAGPACSRGATASRRRYRSAAILADRVVCVAAPRESCTSAVRHTAYSGRS
jgi:hypothetical protein